MKRMYKFFVKCIKLARHLGVLRRIFVYSVIETNTRGLSCARFEVNTAACRTVEIGYKKRELLDSENGGATSRQCKSTDLKYY